MPETQIQYADRKLQEIIDLLENAKTAKAMVNFEIKDTIVVANNMGIPGIVVSVTMNENVLREFKEKSKQ